MTSKERVWQILSRNDVDRPATFDSLMNDALIRYFAGENPDPLDPKPIVHRAISRALDSTRIIIVYPQIEEEKTLPDGTIVQKKRWTTWYKRPIESMEDARTYVIKQIEFFERTPIDMNALIEQYLATSRELDDVFLFANFLAKTGIMLYAEIGLEQFSYLMTEDPELVSRYYEACTRRSIRSIEAATFPPSIQAVFDCEDIAYRGGLIFPPTYLRNEFIPRLERLVDAWHGKGIKLIFHTDGDIMEILPDLVACGIDGLNPLETQAGLDLSEVRKATGDIILVGGVDCSQILPMGTPRQVRDETRRVLRQLGPHSLIGSTSEVHNVVPLENYLALLETVEQWRW